MDLAARSEAGQPTREYGSLMPTLLCIWFSQLPLLYGVTAIANRGRQRHFQP